MLSMKPLIIQIAKGMINDKFTKTRARRVSRIPRSRKRMKKGRTITTAGTNWVARIVTNMIRSPFNLNLEKL